MGQWYITDTITMKKVFLLIGSLLLVASIMSVSCKKDKDDGGSFVVEAKNVIGNDYDIATAAGLVEGEDDEDEIASAPYKNNGFKMELPATVANKYLWMMNDEGDLDGIISDNNAKITTLYLVAMDSDKDEIGEFYLEDESDDYYAGAIYMYADRDFTIKGTIEEYYEEDDDYYNVKLDCTFKKGWNVLYYVEDNGWDESYTTKKPSDINLKWYFYSWNYDKSPTISPKHKKAELERFRSVK